MDDLPIGAQMREYPIDEMLIALAKGLVKGQWELNQSAIDALREAATEEVTLPDKSKASLLSLGLSPSFYTFDQVTIDLSIEMAMYVEEEAALAVSVNASGETGSDGGGDGDGEGSGGGKSTSVAFGASIDVSMSRKYGVDMAAATRLSATISAVPPPAALLEAFKKESPKVEVNTDGEKE